MYLFKTLSAFTLIMLISLSALAIGPIVGNNHGCIGNAWQLTNGTLGGAWASSDQSVATIGSANGMLVLQGHGIADITYTVDTSIVHFTVTVDPLPIKYQLTGIHNFCGSGSNIGISGSQVGITYMVMLNGVFLMNISGTGYPILFGGRNLTEGDVIYVVAANCGQLIDSATIHISAAVCTGTPDIGYAFTNASVLCYDSTLFLGLSNVPCGTSYQWQSSPNGSSWSDIPGATSVPCNYTPSASLYYRCQATCNASGLSASSAPVFVAINPNMQLRTHITVPDTACSATVFSINTCGYSPGAAVTTRFGDGTHESTSLSTSHAAVSHFYAQAGKYTVRQILLKNSVPVDSVTFSYTHSFCNTLHVQLYYDANNNGSFDPGEMSFRIPVAIAVDSNGHTLDTISATSGFYYNARGPKGTVYSFRLISSPHGFSVTSPYSGIISDTIGAFVNNYPAKYIGLSCGAGASFDLAQYATLRCGYHLAQGIIYVNNATCTPENAVLNVSFSPKYKFGYASPTPTSHSANSITWDLGPVYSSMQVLPYVEFGLGYTDSFLMPGDTITSAYSISPVNGDQDPTNNFVKHLDTVKAGYDPNEMSVSPAGYILTPAPLQYTVAFENTGNAPATNIYVLDTLPDNVDPASFRLVAASAPMMATKICSEGNTMLKFDFPDINLLDSSHHGQCNGMVTFTINAKPKLSTGTRITNRAGIYFDFNPVVMTNEVTNIVGLPPLLTVFDKAVSLYPNPATSLLTIKASSEVYSSFTVTNSIGQVMIQNEIKGTQTTVAIDALAKGLYIVNLRGPHGTSVGKFVKL